MTQALPGGGDLDRGTPRGDRQPMVARGDPGRAERLAGPQPAAGRVVATEQDAVDRGAIVAGTDGPGTDVHRAAATEVPAGHGGGRRLVGDDAVGDAGTF